MSQLPDNPYGNIFNNLLFADVEIEENICDSNLFHVKRITSTGQTTDILDQEDDEWVVLLQGNATVTFFDKSNQIQGTRKLVVGDWLFIPAHQKHQVINCQQQNIWLCFHINKIL